MLETRLFQRHARGYTPTEAGLDLLRVAKTTDEQLKQFVGRTRGRGTKVTGEIVVTSLEIVAPLVVQALARFRDAYPDTTVRYIASGKLLNLAYGEAHIAVRAGNKPEDPDNVVRPFFDLYSTFYAHDRYVAKHGFPRTETDFIHHQFLSHEDPTRTPFFQWLESVVPGRNIILRSQSQRVLMESLLMGLGIGFMPVFQAQQYDTLHEIIPPRSTWSVPLWLVTHVDLHRTAKVQAISSILREVASELIGFGIENQ